MALGFNAPGGPQVVGVPAAAYAAPAIDDLVRFTTNQNFEFSEAVANQNPDGKVVAINDAGDRLTVQLFGQVSFEELPYNAGVVRGCHVEGSNVAGAVSIDNVNGRGYVIAVDHPRTGICTVAYGLMGAGSGA